MPPLATTYALHFALEHLRTAFAASTESLDRREVETLAAGLKAFATRHATDTIQTCRECCGGQGYLAVNRFADLKADTDVFTTFEGDNIVLLQLVAKGLLTGYKRQFGQMNLRGLIKFVASRAATSLIELNPIATRMTDPDHLRDREFHLAAFRWREHHLLTTVARRLKKRMGRGLPGHQALIECQDHLVALARCHVERVVLEQFAAAIERCPDDRQRTALASLCDLYALWHIERDRGWFQENGYLEDGKSKAIRKQVTQLCGEVRQQAVHWVEAFNIPPQLLAAPIAF